MKDIKVNKSVVAKIVLILLAILLINAVINKPATVFTQQAKDTTFRNSFISGCTQEGGTQSVCSCAYDKLLVMYPDFSSNQARINRILNQGYSQSETDTIVGCASQPTLQTN